MELVIASSNTHKVLQFREILKDLKSNLHVLSLFDFPHYKLPAFDSSISFAENAKLKANHAATALQKNCLAEQWGLVIPALAGIETTLFEQTGHVKQTKKILSALEGKKEYERMAYLESCIACATPQGTLKESIGRAEGQIAETERGKSSSDFDSIFIKHDYMKTLAELPVSVRLRISHRRKALEKLIGFFDALLR
jgi:XTP/dITP diphosphohydrolase